MLSTVLKSDVGTERNLTTLLRSMRPTLRDGEYVFCALPHGVLAPDVESVCAFREDEGLTIVVGRGEADTCGLPYESVFRWITLTVHSSLDAVGFLAEVTGALAAHGISTNAVSAYYHDHLFVPADRANEALALLRTLSNC